MEKTGSDLFVIILGFFPDAVYGIFIIIMVITTES